VSHESPFVERLQVVERTLVWFGYSHATHRDGVNPNTGFISLIARLNIDS
jgi:hypothetical protein